MNRLSFLSFLICINLTVFSQSVNIIPAPVELSIHSGKFVFNTQSKIHLNRNYELKSLAAISSELLSKALGFKLETETESSAIGTSQIYLLPLRPYETKLGNEGYRIEITPQNIFIYANEEAGFFYAFQTLWQCLTPGNIHELQAMEIVDYPRFGWRGMHLDVSRHFMPKEFIYKYIDYIAMHKMNIFHWHLADDQGWRIEIKKYPLLTEKGAVRVDREHLSWNSRDGFKKKGEDTNYGGFYTQQEIREIVKYAQDRFVTIVPEIEMPAHCMAALSAYPQFSCNGKDLGVPSGGVWPNLQIYCAGNDSTFVFLEDILKEVMELFPSTYIHIGGDEAAKTSWKNCPKCQARIKKEGLKNEEELQSYFIQRIEKFVLPFGRKIIGWDEILEGGLAPEAAVMSWRGEEGGIAAARMSHYVVMSPGSHCYFDHYQGDPAAEPQAFGGLTTLKKVYSYEPVPEDSLSSEQQQYIMGAQANLWTEFISTPQHAEYMIMPRMAALCEVLWSPKEKRNWDDFSLRMESQYKRYEKLGINYSKSAFQVKIISDFDPMQKIMVASFTTEVKNPEIRYTMDGSDPTATSELYKSPIEIQTACTLKATVFQNGKAMSKPIEQKFLKHKAMGCKVSLVNPASPSYPGTGAFTLSNGVEGTINFTDKKWLGFNGTDMIALLEFENPQDINSIKINAIQANPSWIFLPKEVIYEVSSDGINFTRLGLVKNNIPVGELTKAIYPFLLKKEVKNVKFIRITAKNLGKCPKGHNGEGQAAWLFVDEIVVE